MQLDFMKHHFSGMLIVRQLPNEEIRLLASTYFGLSLFDFSLQKGVFKVNSCIEPMQKEKVLKLLEADFKQLFLPTTHCRIKTQSPLLEKRISGKGFGKSVFTLSEYAAGVPERAQIRHPWIRLTIRLNLLPLPSPAQANEFEQLMDKIRLEFATNPSIDSLLTKYDAANGSFTDIDYSREERTNWGPLTHINRVYDFVFAYTNPRNRYYEQEELYHKIVAALDYWYQRNPQCNNWWYNQIAEPQLLGVLLIQMRTGKKLIPAELETKTLLRMKTDGGNPGKWTGANMTDIALHWIYRACLTADATMLKQAVGYVFNPVKYTSEEGFQYDNSYFQHGQQLYIGGYGDEILKGVTQVATYTQGTQYAMPTDKLELVSKFMRNTYYQTIRGKYMLFDALGRSVSRPDITDKSSTALVAKRMMALDPQHSAEYDAIIRRLQGAEPASYQLKPLHTHYFNGDYTLHVRPGYTFDVRTTSNRTSRCEYGNGENLKTYFMSDGCTNLTIGGNEYFNIFPVWNWAQIPGVTAPQLPTIPLAPNAWQTTGTSTFAGGVSDSIYGATAYAYHDTYEGINTAAKKAWFFFDDEVVCLGAGITSTASAPLNTTVNQCNLIDQQVTVSKKGRVSALPMGAYTYNNELDWALNNGIGYLFPQGGNLFLTTGTQSGSWYDINQSTPKTEVEEPVFTLGFDHGLSPQNATYAYIIVPNKKTPAEMAAYPTKNIEILANTDSVQVVRNKQLGIWQMVFYQKATFVHKEMSVSVDKGCALLFRDITAPEATFHIADPAQAQAKIEVEVRIPSVSPKAKRVVCDFTNTGVYAGKSKAYRIKSCGRLYSCLDNFE